MIDAGDMRGPSVHLLSAIAYWLEYSRMRTRTYLRRLLTAPPLTGRQMLLCAIVALALPTLLRASIQGAVQGVGFSPYVPFVMLSALSLDWRVATLVALVSATLGDYFFVGQPFQLLESSNDVIGMFFFGIVSALAILLARTLRKVAADPLWLNGPDEASEGVIFSLGNGQAFVSWYGQRSFVPLGPEDEVAEMMEDFLAQRALGRRLATR
jgi:hypothetical protein